MLDFSRLTRDNLHSQAAQDSRLFHRVIERGVVMVHPPSAVGTGESVSSEGQHRVCPVLEAWGNHRGRTCRRRPSRRGVAHVWVKRRSSLGD